MHWQVDTNDVDTFQRVGIEKWTQAQATFPILQHAASIASTSNG